MPRARINGGIKGQVSATGGIRTASEVADLKTIGFWTGSNVVPIAGSSIISTVQYLTPTGANTAVTAVSAVTGNTIAIYGQNFDAVNNVYLNNTLIPNTRVSSTVIQANVVPFIATSSTYVTVFNGVTADTVSLANSAPLSLAGTSWTVECWVNPTGNYVNYTSLFAKRDTAGTSYEGFLNITNGYVGFYNGTVYLSSTVLTANVWSHCAWVYNGSSVTIYVNGVAVSNSGAISITNYTAPLSIGSAFYNGIYQEFLYGSISNFRIVKGVAVYTGNFAAPLMPLATSQTAGTNIAAVSAAQTSLLTLQSFTPADNSINAATVTQIGNPITELYSLFGGNTYNLSVFSATSGVGAIYYSGVQFQAPPVWSAYTVIAQPNGTVNYQLSARGAISYYLTSGDISTMSLSTSGLITGTYLGSSTISFVVTAYNAFGLGTPQTVTVSTSYATSYLIVGGGAGGSPGPTGGPSFTGGGGGAGGVLASTFQANAGVSYIVGLSTVPAGQRASGGNSYISASPGITFANIVAVGGGRSNEPGQSNPSGAAAGAVTPTVAFRFPSPAALFYTAAGAQGYPGVAAPGGGGGGAGSTTGTANGGAGYTWPINGIAYAGGGGGANGSGGGAGAGNGGGAGAGGSATNGTGSGGGGNSNVPGSQPGGSGGTGVVVIGYPNARGIQYATGGNLAVTNGYYLHTFRSPGTYNATTTPTWTTGTALTTGVNTDFAVDLISTDVNTVTYYVSAGNTLPAGTTLSTTGVFSGNVTTIGSYSFYVNATNQVGGITARQFTLTVNNTGYTINYLAVGGGGAGGSAFPGVTNGAGGGGGGFLTGQITVPSPTEVTTYTITVGSGGAATAGVTGYGQPGGYSNISAPTITTIAALGGGGGGGGFYPNATGNSGFNGQSGGSGGGGGGHGPGPTELAGQAGLATGSPGLNTAGSQGFPGGFGVGAPGTAPGGGGGAGGAGRSGYQPDFASGVGGIGLASLISGTLVYYAGGGGGQYAPGGSGIGGNGYGYLSSTVASAGAIGTGSGGGGGSNNPVVPTSFNGGQGGGGVVVLRMPTATFSGNYTPVAGTTVANVGGTTILTFTTSGTYVSGPNSNTYTAQYLVVAGGGGGGSGAAAPGGGGGAGGVLTGNTLLSTGTAYPITVGPGGALNTNGIPSTFNGMVAVGGGFGGGGTPGAPGASGNPGGSGGGGSAGGTPAYNVGVGTAGQGYAGGYGLNSARGGGGGGAGGAGSPTPASPVGGNPAGPGGIGYTWPITGLTYAGGGGGASTISQNPPSNGGTGGPGGGGSGSGGTSTQTPGTNGLGGGGGGGGGTGVGGSGTVIISVPTPRYPGSAPGATVSNPANAPGQTVLTYTAPGTYTA